MAAVPVTAAAIELEPVLITGLSSPVLVTNARDGSGRLFVVERGGVIKVLEPGKTSPAVFLDIATRVLSGGEQGLLGLAFHPQFATEPALLRRLHAEAGWRGGRGERARGLCLGGGEQCFVAP